MSNCFDMRCPKCGKTGSIDVAATIWVRLTSDGTDADGSADGSHEWADESPAACRACGFRGTAAAFGSES